MVNIMELRKCCATWAVAPVLLAIDAQGKLDLRPQGVGNDGLGSGHSLEPHKSFRARSCRPQAWGRRHWNKERECSERLGGLEARDACP